MTLSSSPGESKVQNAGYQLDAEIAERVMGYVWHSWKDSGGFTYLLSPGDEARGESSIARRYKGVLEVGEWRGPRYSRSIADAWLVVEKMGAWGFDVRRREHTPGDVTYEVTIYPRSPKYHDSWEGGCTRRATSAPLAICLAALAALENAPSSSVPSTGGELND